MKTKLFLFGLFLISKSIAAQSAAECAKEIKEIEQLYAFTKDTIKLKKGNLFTNRGINLIFKEVQQQISGVNAKDAKYKGLSGTIDDKGINFNGTFSNKSNNLLGLTVSATSKDKFVDLFSSNELKNIYSVGLNYKFFFSGTVRYSNKEKVMLLNSLDSVLVDTKVVGDCEKVKKTDALQKEFNVSKSLWWININFKYNNNPVKILDETQTTFTSNYYNEFLSADLSLNYLRKTKRNLNWYFSPTLNFSNSRNFNSDEIKNVNIVTPITIGGIAADEIKAITYYQEIENRIYTAALDLPFVFFFPKQNLGFDIAFKAGVNDPDDNNVSARFGVYIPFYLTDKKESITIEPILKFNKLFGSSSNNFIEDNLAFGFNISVAIPEFLE